MRRSPRFLDRLRREASDLENQVVDEFLAGRLDRRGLLREGSRFGLALPLIGGLLGAADPFGAPFARAQTGKPDATIRVASPTPAGAVEPVTVANSGGLLMLMQTGEFLIFDQPDLVLKPMLALSWKGNDDGTVWTFKLRPNVKFHNGHVMNADDVVATMDRLANPKNGSNALSAFRGVLSLGGTRKVDDLTVEFHLDAPNGNFPYIVSSDNYNAIILPAGLCRRLGEDVHRDRAVHPRQTFSAKVSRPSFVRQPPLLGPQGAAEPRRHGVHVLQRPVSRSCWRCRAASVDVVTLFAAQGAQAAPVQLQTYNVIRLKILAATHRELAHAV